MKSFLMDTRRSFSSSGHLSASSLARMTPSYTDFECRGARTSRSLVAPCSPRFAALELGAHSLRLNFAFR